MNILESTYFEVALILRESLFLSSLLLNSEAWVNYNEKDIIILEQCDEMLLTMILDCDSRSSNPPKYHPDSIRDDDYINFLCLKYMFGQS